MKLVTLTSHQWLTRAKQIQSTAMTPWPSVAKNIFCSLQWTGKDAIEKSQRHYFGLEINNKIITSMEVYFLSSRTIRVRGFFCDPQFRKKNYTKICLDMILEEYKGKADRVVIFSTSSGLGFFKKIGFQIAPLWPTRPLEYYDFERERYVTAANEEITLLDKLIN